MSQEDVERLMQAWQGYDLLYLIIVLGGRGIWKQGRGEVRARAGCSQMARLDPLQRGSLHQTVEEKRNWHQAVA